MKPIQSDPTKSNRPVVRPVFGAVMAGSLLSLLLAAPGTSRADGIDYAVTTQNQLGTVDLQTGTFTPIGAINGISGGGNIGDVARLPGGLLYGVNASSTLVVINPVTLTTSSVGPCGNGIEGLAIRQDGTLFGANQSQLFTINANTGAATLVGVMGSFSGYWDIKFDSSGHLYSVEQTGGTSSFSSLYTVNTTTGQATLVGPTGFKLYCLDIENGTLYGFTTDGKIISLNTSTGAGTLVAAQTQSDPIVAAATAANPLRITSIVRTNGTDVFITWNTSGTNNIVQVTAGTGASGSYSPVGFADLTNLAITTATTNLLDVGGATNMPSRYYRVRSPQ